MYTVLEKEVEKNFAKLAKLFSPEMLIKFSNLSEEELESLNFGLGTLIRLKLLRPKSALYRYFIESGISDKDEMAMMLLRAFYKSDYPRRILIPWGDAT